MKKIAIVGCTKSKKNIPCKAEEMYSPSTLFKLEMEYIKSNIKPDDIYILSAKYGLIEKSTLIEPYNEYLKDKSKDAKRQWNENVLKQIKAAFHAGDSIYFLCGKEYYKKLITPLNQEGYICVIPLQGKGGMGYQMQWLKEQL